MTPKTMARAQALAEQYIRICRHGSILLAPPEENDCVPSSHLDCVTEWRKVLAKLLVDFSNEVQEEKTVCG